MSKTIHLNAEESASIMILTADEIPGPWLAISYPMGFFRINTDGTTSSRLRMVADELERLQTPKVCPVTLDPIMQEVLASICPVPKFPEVGRA